MSNTITFDGYLAELISLRAERAGKSPEDYVVSFFADRCNAPAGKDFVSPKRCNAPCDPLHSRKR